MTGFESRRLPERFGGSGRPGGFEPASQRTLHARHTRPAESALHRVLTGSAHLFQGDDYPQLLAEAAAGTQRAVTTGRRIAVLGTRGGAGKSTVAALLARVYAAMRADAVAAVDLAPSAGTLGLLLGVPHAPPLEAAAARLGAGSPDSLRGLTALLTVAEPANLLVTGRRRALEPGTADGQHSTAAAVWTPAGPQCPPAWTPASGAPDPAGAPGPAGASPAADPTAADGATRLSRALSRYCPITIFDCGPGLTDPGTVWALGHSHLAVFVTPASVAGVQDAVEFAGSWRHGPATAAVPLLVLVVQSSRALSASKEARRLHRAGVDALHLGSDRHLAAGVEVLPPLLSRRTRLEAVFLASRVLAAAAPEQAFARSAAPAAERNACA